MVLNKSCFHLIWIACFTSTNISVIMKLRVRLRCQIYKIKDTVCVRKGLALGSRMVRWQVVEIQDQVAGIRHIQCIQKVFRPLHFFYMFCCSLMLKTFKFILYLINLHSIHHRDKAKTGFQTFVQIYLKKINIKNEYKRFKHKAAT